MKKFILLFVFTCMAFQLLAQTPSTVKSDRIYKADNTVIDCKIMEVSNAEIKYKKANYLDGPTYSISKTDVVTIQYANGDSEVINVKSANTNQTATQTAATSSSSERNRSARYSAYGIDVYFTNGTHFGGVYDFMWAVGGTDQSYIGFALTGFYSSKGDYSGGTLYIPFQYKFFPSTSNFYVEGTVGPRYTTLSYGGLANYGDESTFTISGGLNVGYLINGSFDFSLRYHSYMGLGVGIAFTGLTR